MQNILFIIVFLSLSTSLNALNTSAGSSKTVTSNDSNIGIFDKLAPGAPRWTEAPGMDLFVRSILKWDSPSTAGNISDICLYGVIFPSIALAPAISEQDYSKILLMNVEVFLLNGLITNAVKYIAGRQRPGVRFGTYTAAELGNDANLSFFSGHASFSFSLAVAGAYTLEESYPAQSGFIWTGALSLAAFTSYLRIAADLHYFSDVITGMIVGTAIGYLVPHLQKDLFFPQKESQKQGYVMQISFKL